MQLLKSFAVLICSLAILGGCASGRTAFDKGQKLEGEGDLDRAVLKYAEAATADPESAEYRLQFLKVSADAAKIHLEKGEKAFSSGRYDDALKEYQTAYGLDPTLEIAKQQSEVTKKLRMSQALLKEGQDFEKNHKNREALLLYRKVLEQDAVNKEATEGIARLLKTMQPKFGGHELNLKSNKPITLKFKDAKIKDVFNIITKLSGITFIFDDSVKDSNFSIYLENATFHQVLDVVSELNKLEEKY